MVYHFITLSFFFISFSVHTFAQKHDYNWISGYHSTHEFPGFSNTILNFNFNPVTIEEIGVQLRLVNCAGSFSDSTGNLLYLTDGAAIYSPDGEIMENGDTINPGEWWVLSRSNNPRDGYISWFSPMSIPAPGLPNHYYLVHAAYSLTPGPQRLRISDIYFSLIDMEANNGKGKVILKNQVIIQGNLIMPTLTKHANGRDWWLITGNNAQPLQHIFYIGPNGVNFHGTQNIGPEYAFPEPFLFESGTLNYFSPDGSIYLRHDPKEGLRIFDFDRCAGQLSNLRLLPYEPSGVYGAAFAAFSASNQYLYLSHPGWVWQLDVNNLEISAKGDTITTWELGYCPYPWSTLYAQAQLAPDDKIYYAVFASSSTCMNVIHRPNLYGDAVDIEEGAVSLPNYTEPTLCQFPNYRLGVWVGSPCDSLAWEEYGGEPKRGGFAHPTYTGSKQESEPINNYRILSPIPGTDCPGCTPDEARYRGDPTYHLFVNAMYRIRGEWPAELAHLRPPPPALGESTTTPNR